MATKKISLRYDGITEADALLYASMAVSAMPEHKGCIVFKSGIQVWFSDKTKNLAMLVIKRTDEETE